MALASAAALALLALACTRPLPPGWGAGPPPSAASPGQRQDIEAATRAYVLSHSAVREFAVEVQAVSGDYARARVTPPPGVTDPAWVFLVRQGGQWQGLTIGTAFPPQTYEVLGIPEAVRLPARPPAPVGTAVRAP